jgi:hypothetical protein
MGHQYQIWPTPVRSHLVVQEDEVHLYEGEGHPGGRCQRQQHVVTLGVALHLEVLSELEPRVDHTTDTKRWNTQRQLVAQSTQAPRFTFFFLALFSTYWR